MILVIRSYWAMDKAALADYTDSGPLVNDAFFFSTNKETLAIMKFMQTIVSKRKP
jgi:hypothetical protein